MSSRKIEMIYKVNPRHEFESVEDTVFRNGNYFNNAGNHVRSSSKRYGMATIQCKRVKDKSYLRHLSNFKSKWLYRVEISEPNWCQSFKKKEKHGSVQDFRSR